MKERYKFLLILSVFLVAYFIPFSNSRVQTALLEAFLMIQEYARNHVLLCLVPAFFMAGAIAVFVSENAVIKYFGREAKKVLAYGVASVCKYAVHESNKSGNPGSQNNGSSIHWYRNISVVKEYF